MPQEPTFRDLRAEGPAPPAAGPPGRDEAGDPEYGDLLLVDLLHPDWRNFLTRYRTDLAGFAVVSLICLFIVAATRWLAMIGAGAGR